MAKVSGRTAVYVCYDADKEVIYVGISSDLTGRIHDHDRGAPWWEDVRLIDVEWFSTRELAMGREALLIHVYQPPNNVQHKGHLTSACGKKRIA